MDFERGGIVKGEVKWDRVKISSHDGYKRRGMKKNDIWGSR